MWSAFRLVDTDSVRAVAQMNWTTRPATIDDAALLTDIVVEATKAQGRWPDDRDEMSWREKFMTWSQDSVSHPRPGAELSVIEVDDQPVGRLRVLRESGRVELAGIQLLPDLQGQGIGSAIVRNLQGEVAAGGADLSIGVEKDNPRARALYERLGCVLIDETAEEHLLRWAPSELRTP